MILAQDLRDQMAFALDAEGSEHYLDAPDYIPAINAAIKWLTSVVNSAYGDNKISEEFFRDLSYAGVFLADNNSRISFDVFPSEVWTILAVYPNPNTEAIVGQAIPNTADTTQSYFLNHLRHVDSSDYCKRLTIEEWSKSKENPFEDGYDGDQICDALKRYAYLSPINYENVGTGNNSREIEVRPSVANKNVSIFWAKTPEEITDLTENIEFPQSVFQLLFDKALNYIAYKQGDATTLHSVTNKDIELLLTVI